LAALNAKLVEQAVTLELQAQALQPGATEAERANRGRIGLLAT